MSDADLTDIPLPHDSPREPDPAPIAGEKAIALVVDLDGTLLRSDLLVESGTAWIVAEPKRLFGLPALLKSGKAALKAAIAAQTAIDVSLLPYDETVLAAMAAARAEGRRVYIASASNARYVAAVAAHVGVDGWFASDATTNLAADAKAQRLVEAFGHKGFDYIGNDNADLPVWAVSRRSLAVRPSEATRAKLMAIDPSAQVLVAADAQPWRAWIKLVRPHQWAKNVLVFVPLATAHHFDLASIVACLFAWLAFSLAASSIYIVNDLVDIRADREHPSKRRRPLAAGTVPILRAPLVAAGLMLTGLGIGALISWSLAGLLVGYLVLTTAYSFSLKRKMLVDVVALASLYTLRVLAGAAAIGVPASEWLLAFSMFVFTALALIKRYVELTARIDADLPEATNRNYLKSDLSVVAALTAASGFNAVTVFALYISSDAVRLLYPHPGFLWLVCPILMYWIGRMVIMAQRRYIDDDPVLFALHDRNSQIAFVLIALLLVIAGVKW
ncbi:UbiA family prenyltransferase [Oryzibacter oryziterrae]|uniref:UbiA family prenyltransferase n=1 Tax=Oryzibacter oryziterrae TaxID=2766474 RepID=UPI001EFFD791|nr:UbiA family prenyltransferase [Oryzibacter oryziterrae]